MPGGGQREVPRSPIGVPVGERAGDGLVNVAPPVRRRLCIGGAARQRMAEFDAAVADAQQAGGLGVG